MAKKSGKKKNKKTKTPTEKRVATGALLDNDLSAALDVAGEALEMIGRIAAEAAGRLRALAEVHRRRSAKDGEE
jgi:hypothetical protein